MAYIPKVTFRDGTLNTIMEGVQMDGVQKVVFEKLLPNITNAIIKNKKECTLCYAQDDFTIVIPKSSYKGVLQTLETYFLKMENYEVCAKLVELFNKLE